MSTEVASLKIKVDTSDTVKATNDLNKLTNTAKSTEKQTQSLASAFFSLKGAIATLGVAQTAQYFVKTADAMNLLNARLKLTTSSTEEYASQQKQLLAISLGSHTALSDTVTLYTKLDPALKQLGASTSQVNSVVDSFSKGLQLGGASAQESSSAIQQFAQAMGSGVLRAEEFNSMAEASPKLMKYMADGMGVPQTALREMAANGELTALRVSNALLKMKANIDRDFTTLPLTVGKATTDTLTLMSKGIENIDSAIGITKGLATAITELSSNIGTYSQTIISFYQETAKFIQEHNEALDTTGTILKTVAAAYIGFAVTSGILKGIQGITKAVLGLRTAILALEFSIPVLGWVAGAVGVLAGAWVYNHETMNKAIGGNIEDIEKLQTAQELLAEKAELSKKKAKIQNDKFMWDSEQATLVGELNTRLEITQTKLDAINKAKGMFNIIPKEKTNFEEIFGIDEYAYYKKADSIKEIIVRNEDELIKLSGTARQKLDLDIKNNIVKMKNAGATQIEIEKYKNEQITEFTKKEASKQDAINNKALELSKTRQELAKIGLTEYEIALANINEKTIEWQKKGVSENEILTAKIKLQDELNKKTNFENLKENISFYERKIQLLDNTIDKEKELQGIAYTNRLIEIEGSNKSREEKDKLIAKEIELNNLTIQSMNARNNIEFQDTMSNFYDDMLDSQLALNNAVYDFGSGFDGVSSKIGAVSKSIAAMSSLELTNKKEASKLDKKYIEQFNKYAGDVDKTNILALQYSKDKAILDEQNIQAQLAGYANIAGAMSNMFTQGSRDAAAFHLIESGLALATGIRAILTQGSGDPYTAFARMASMAAIVSSMLGNIGVAFGMNKTTTSSDAFSAQSANTGTGSVLGDTKKASDSIKNSLSILEDFAKPNFRLATSMDESLKSIDSKIGGVTSLLIQNSATALGTNYTGGYDTGFKNNLGLNDITLGLMSPINSIISKIPILGQINGLFGSVVNSVLGGLFGKTSVSRALTDSGIYFADAYLKDAVKQLNGMVYQTISTTTTKKSWFSSSSSTSISTYFSALDKEISNQFSLVLGNIYDTVYQAGIALNLSSSSLESSLNSFIVSIGKISLKGKTGTQIQELLTNVFSGISDNLAKAVVPALSEFQAVGEGMFETLTRVATGMEQANYYIGRLGSTFQTIDFTDIINKQGVVGFEALYQSILKVEKGANFNYILSTLSGTAEELYSAYIALDLIRDRLTFFGKGLDSLSASMIGGAGSLESLSDGIQSYIENFYSDTEQQALKISELTQLLNRAGVSEIPTSISGFRKLIESIDTTSKAGQYLYGNLISLSGAFSDVYSEIDSQRTSLLSDITNFVKELRGTTSSLNAGTTFKTFADSFNAMIDAINNGSSELDSIGATTLTTAQSYLDTVAKTATSAADLKFARQIVANKLESVTTAPNINLGTINDTLKISFNENSVIVNELKQMRTQLEYLNGLNTTQTATQLKTLSATRALIS